MGTRCWFGHKWSKWGMGSAVRKSGTEAPVQYRHCLRCNKLQVSEVTMS